MGVWDTTTPAGSANISDGDDRIREMKVAIQEALKDNDATLGDAGVFPGPSPATVPVYRPRFLKGTTAQRPAATNYGIYVNTTLNTIQRDNGGTWQDIATLIPSGTKEVFYQAAAPTGWTRDTSANDRFLRVVSAGSPGTTGGSFGSLAHTHDLSNSGWAKMGMDSAANLIYADIVTASPSWTTDKQAAVTDVTDTATSASGSAGLGGATDSGATTHGSAQHAYADIMIATKD